MGRCCNPTPGDQIIGYITRGRGATIHRQDCPNILRLGREDRERLVRVDWGTQMRTYPVAIRIQAYDRQGLMGDVSNLLDGEGVNIADVKVNVSRRLAELKLIGGGPGHLPAQQGPDEARERAERYGGSPRERMKAILASTRGCSRKPAWYNAARFGRKHCSA